MVKSAKKHAHATKPLHCHINCFENLLRDGIPSEYCADSTHTCLFLSTHIPLYTFRVMCGFHPRIHVSINTLSAVYLQSYVQVSSTHNCFYQHTFHGIPSELCAGSTHTCLFLSTHFPLYTFRVKGSIHEHIHVFSRHTSEYCADSINTYLFLSIHFPRYTFRVMCRFHQRIPVSLNTLSVVYLQSYVQVSSTHTCFYQHTFRAIPSELCAGFIHAYLFLSAHFPRYTFRVMCGFHPRIPVSINTLFAGYLHSTVQIPSTHSCFSQYTFRAIHSELYAGFIHPYLFLSAHFPRYTFRVMCRFHPRIPVSINTLSALYLQSYVRVSSTHTCFYQLTFRGIPSEYCADSINTYMFLSTHFSRYTFRLMCRFHQRIHVSINTLFAVYLQS